MNSAEQAKQLIHDTIFMTIATADEMGKPHSSPVGFAYDGAYNLYWVSAKDAVHSENIRVQPEVYISILGSTPEGGFDGVYIDARASELSDPAEVEQVITLFKETRKQPPHFVTHSVADVTGAAVWRMYKATPIEVFKRADAERNGQAVTVREKIEL